jgi:hypothetical protein
VNQPADIDKAGGAGAVARAAAAPADGHPFSAVMESVVDDNGGSCLVGWIAAARTVSTNNGGMA